eukprot:m.368726 g.368726  ORF g.368726 m.368726 type:complete len:349 (-) comp56106_c0_seq9:340-1386(-)
MMRRQLTTLSKRLNVAVDMIYPLKQAKERDARRKAVFDEAYAAVDDEHREILNRKSIIEKRMKALEDVEAEQQQQEARKRKIKQAEEEKAEAERISREAEERERIRQAREQAKVLKQSALAELDTFIKSDVGAKYRVEATKEAQKLDAEGIRKYITDCVARARADLDSKLDSLEKQFDYEERAKHEHELPLLKALKKASEEKQRVQWVERRRLREEAQLAEHTRMLELKQKLGNIQPQLLSFIESVQADRQRDYDTKLHEFNVKEEASRKARQEAQERARLEREAREAEEQERIAREEAKREADRLGKLTSSFAFWDCCVPILAFTSDSRVLRLHSERRGRSESQAGR